MKNYKVEIKQTDTYIFDVTAETEEEAEKLAAEEWEVVAANGTYHLYQDRDTETVLGTIYDVTGTDDAPSN